MKKPQHIVRVFAPRAGLEPATLRLTAACSTIELSRNISDDQITKPITNCQDIVKKNSLSALRSAPDLRKNTGTLLGGFGSPVDVRAGSSCQKRIERFSFLICPDSPFDFQFRHGARPAQSDALTPRGYQASFGTASMTGLFLKQRRGVWIAVVSGIPAVLLIRWRNPGFSGTGCAEKGL
jgi:hypothetical protein